MFEFSPESIQFFTALRGVAIIDMVLVFMGRSSIGKSLMSELVAETYSTVASCHFRVNPTGAAETQGIDARLMIHADGLSGAIVIDTAGSDLGVSALQTNVLSTIALLVANSIVYFVDGELHNDEITRLAVGCSMANQVQAMLPAYMSAQPMPRLTVAFSQVTCTRPFQHRESPIEHTIARLTPAQGAHCPGRAIITAQFPLEEINAVVVPRVESALEGNRSLPAVDVLGREDVRAQLAPVARALLDAPTGMAWTGSDLADRFLQVMEAVTRRTGAALMQQSASSVDTLHTCYLTRTIARERSAEVAFLADWEETHADLAREVRYYFLIVYVLSIIQISRIVIS
jgi:hypothetical protein